MQESAHSNQSDGGEDRTANDAGGIVQLVNPDGKGAIVFVCEHASRFVPNEFADLGLDAEALKSHVAWDPGAWAVAKELSAAFDAPLVGPGVSRLVYDCNRPSKAESAVPQKSEIYEIPGNIGLSDSDRLARAERFYLPYRNALTKVLEDAVRLGRHPAFITIHSFTPVYHGTRRTLDLGILHDSDARLADEILRITAAEGELTALINQPYGPKDGVTYTLAEHAIPRGLLNVMIEIRNDLIADGDAQHAMAMRLEGYIRGALANLDVEPTREEAS
ncbi:N-formylglutamate amidohydrolase [Magnetovibrio sp.]|uniref:N-formylglutamate amidohydrolase n=1 Tax=Magnetovibrio sp. TaxID=2024836 RepID=UPI002F943B79